MVELRLISSQSALGKLSSHLKNFVPEKAN